MVAIRHNGGRSQTNLNFLQVGGEYPFINVMKTAQDFSNTSAPNANDTVDPSVRDSDGYPTSIQTGGYYTVCYIPSQTDLPGDWVMAWDGNGTVRVPGTLTSAVGTDTSSGGSGSLTFTPTSQRLTPGAVSTSASPNHIRNIRIYHSSEATRFGSGAVFGAKFLARLLEANFGVIRFLNWQVSSNIGNVTTWSLKRPTTYFSYESNHWFPSLYFGSTTNSGNAYSITTGRARAPIHGDIIQCKINADATQVGTCSLNADAQGAKNILSIYSTALSAGGNTYPLGGRLATFIFDGTLDAWIKHGGDLGFLNIGILSGVPVDVCLALCAEVGAHPWFVTPHLTCDPMTDWMPSLMQYVFDNKQTWMTPRFEPPNELWNGRFAATGYANAKAVVYAASAGWASNGYNAWYGKVLSTVGQAAATIFNVSNLGSGYHIIGGVQTSTYASPTDNDERFKSTSYVGQSTSAQGGYVKSAAYNWVSHLACAQYWATFYAGTGSETALATAYASASTSQKASIAASYADGSLGSGGQFTLGTLASGYSAFKTYLLALPVPIRAMCGYEGCYSPADYGGDANLNALALGSRSAENTGGYLVDLYYNFSKLTDSTFRAEFPSNFIIGDFNTEGTGQYVGGQTSYIWSIFGGDIYATATPQWSAICRYNAAIRAPGRLRLHC